MALSPAVTGVQMQKDAATPSATAVLVSRLGLCRNQDRMEFVR